MPIERRKSINLVGVEERIEVLVLLAYKRSHFVGEQGVKPHVLKAQFLMATPQLGLPVRAQGKRGVPASNRVLPEMGERLRRLR